jgi:cysteine desulfurase
MKKGYVYLDHAATTPLDPEALKAMLPFLKAKFGNASALCSMGREAKQSVEEARRKAALLIGAEPEEIYFTSGGSESDNWAVFGAVRARPKKNAHIITSRIEHHAVLEPCRILEKQGFAVSYLPVDSKGFVNPDDARKAVTPQTVLISIMHANNEIGTIEPVEEIGALAQAKGVHFHVDAVQTAGHIPVEVNKIGCDSLSLSGHKFNGPKGGGALYLRKGAGLEKLIAGGGQEKTQRAGTYNVPGIVGLGKAAELAMQRMPNAIKEMTALRDKLISGIESSIKGVALNGDRLSRLPNNVNFSITGIEGESLILAMDMEGFCVSTGAACASGSLEPSHVLLAIGCSPDLAHSALRLTLGAGNNDQQIARVLEALPRVVAALRKMTPAPSPTKR